MVVVEIRLPGESVEDITGLMCWDLIMALCPIQVFHVKHCRAENDEQEAKTAIIDCVSAVVPSA